MIRVPLVAKPAIFPIDLVLNPVDTAFRLS